MTIPALFLLALGLSMDAFAVSVSNGICWGKYGARRVAVPTALAFGVFQGLMPLLGYFAGQLISSWLEKVDHWISLVLLSVIGLKMIYDTLAEMKTPEEERQSPKLSYRLILLQAFATSVDAFAVGVALVTVNVNIWQTAAFITSVTFCCCLPGVLLGGKIGVRFKQKAELFGGALLVGIGLRLFFVH